MGCEETEEQKKKEGFFWKTHFWFLRNGERIKTWLFWFLEEKRFSRLKLFFCVCVEIQRGGDRLRKRIKWFWFLVWVDCWIFSLFFVFAE